MLPISQIIKDMISNRMRLALTILAVAWGTFAITIMLAVGEGLRITFSNVNQSAQQEALLVSGGASSETYQGQASNIPIIFDEQDFKKLKLALSNKAFVSATINDNATIFYGKNSKASYLTAIDPIYPLIHTISLKQGGRNINVNDNLQERQVIILGQQTAKALFTHGENPVGKWVRIGKKAFLVIGVQRKSLSLFATNRMPDEYNNWIPMRTYQGLNDSRHYAEFIIAPFALADIPQLQKHIQFVIANSRHFNPNDPSLVNFINLQDQKTKLNLFLLGLEIMLGIIGGLTLIVAGVGIANVMHISVKRATREIGIRMAIGATTYDILSYYAAEALLTTAIGGCCGLIMSQAVIMMIKRLPMNPILAEYFGSPQPVLSINVILIVILALGIVGLLAGIFPAHKASTINPAEALRHEK